MQAGCSHPTAQLELGSKWQAKHLPLCMLHQLPLHGTGQQCLTLQAAACPKPP